LAAMKIGCCGSMVTSHLSGIGFEVMERLEELGYDYIELSLAHIARLSPDEFAQFKEYIHASKLECLACNNFFPAEIRLTGENANMDQIMAYVDHALARAGQLGVKFIVFGSSGAKNVPPGFSHAEAWQQIITVLREIDPIAAKYGITICIEPLNKKESNIVNTVAEGLQLAKEVDREHIKLLADYYHMALEGEPLSILESAIDYIKHTHFADPCGRVFPLKPTDQYTQFITKLKELNYTGGISIEAYSDDFTNDAETAIGILKQYT
jgi:D-psicose/D-tagatose/L-ribulose 3-epimerase